MPNLNDYLHGNPKPRPRWDGIRIWMREILGFVVLLSKSYSPNLASPAESLPRNISLEACDGEALLRISKALFDDSVHSIETVQAKANSLLGFSGIAVPLFVALAVYARQSLGTTLSGGTGAVILVLSGASVLVLLLSIAAALRCIAVGQYDQPFINMVFDSSGANYHTPTPQIESVTLLECCMHNAPRAAWLATLLRAAQRFFALALVFALLSGMLALFFGTVTPAVADHERVSVGTVIPVSESETTAIPGDGTSDCQRACPSRSLSSIPNTGTKSLETPAP